MEGRDGLPTRVEEYFMRKKQAVSKLYQIVITPPIQHFTLKCCFLIGPRASENVDCYPKMGEIIFFGFCSLRQGGKVFLNFKKLKNIEKL